MLTPRHLHRMPYRDAWALQKELLEARARGESGDVLLVVEHEPVVTTGRKTQAGFLVGAEPGASHGTFPDGTRFEIVDVERGGEATYHGPGQVVVYPIVKLADDRHDLHGWMRALEQAGIDALADCGLATGRREGATGIWTADGARKLASIGVAAKRWITYHGMALNHSTDLSHFTAIVPCGFEASVMTSVTAEMDDPPTRDVLIERLVAHLDTQLAPFRAAR